MNFEERPGTSFTSKRQVQTEQRKRQQMNLGTLETEDKSGARKLQEELIKKDQQIQFLQKNTKAMKIKELEIELLSYQQETQRLKSLIGMKFNETDADTMRLRADNKLLEDDVKQLKIKCKEFESKATMYQNEKIKKDKLNQYLKNQIESLKFKDPEYKKLNKITENEQQLKQDIDSKQVQIDTLISSLKSKDAQYFELDKKMNELERAQQKIMMKNMLSLVFWQKDQFQGLEEVQKQYNWKLCFDGGIQIDQFRNLRKIKYTTKLELFQTKYKNPLEDYIIRQNKSEFCTVEDLEEALKFVEQSIQLLNYIKQNTRMSLAAKGLIEFVNPYKLPKFVKQVHLQMKELEGRQPFGQGLYHCSGYEDLIQKLTITREKYRSTSDISIRKQLATQEYETWRQYIINREMDLPENHKFTEKQKNDLRRSYEVFIAKNEKGVKPSEMLNVFNDYTRVNQFTIPIDNWCVLQMINFNMGYFMNMNRLIQFEDVVDLINTKVVATYERSLGQDLLFREICSFGYWNLFDKKQGYMSFRDFSNFVKIFKINIESNQVLKEFGFAANLFQGEFKKEIDPKEDVIRFDFFRYLFLERNL